MTKKAWHIKDAARRRIAVARLSGTEGTVDEVEDNPNAWHSEIPQGQFDFSGFVGDGDLGFKLPFIPAATSEMYAHAGRAIALGILEMGRVERMMMRKSMGEERTGPALSPMMAAQLNSSSLLCQSVYGSIEALRSWAVSHVVRGGGIKSGGSTKRTKSSWSLAPSSSKDGALWEVGKRMSRSSPSSFTASSSSSSSSSASSKQRTRTKEARLGGSRKEKRKKSKKKRRKRSIDGDVGYGKVVKGKKGTKALDMTSYNLPNFVEEKRKDMMRSCETSAFTNPRNGVATNHYHGSGYVRNTETLDPIVGTTSRSAYHRGDRPSALASFAQRQREPITSRAAYRKRIEAELAEARAESFRKTSSRYLRDPSNLALAGVSPKSKSRKMADDESLIFEERGGGGGGGGGSVPPRIGQRAGTGHGTINSLAADLDRRLAGVRARGMSGGYSRAMQQLSSRKARPNGMPNILPSRSLLPKVGGSDGGSSGEGSRGGRIFTSAGASATPNPARAVTASSRGDRSMAPFARGQRESKKSDGSQDELMRSLEERWRQLGLPTSSDLRCVCSGTAVYR